jgi:hypothetical protein
MPSWWSMQNLSHLQNSKIGNLICTGFLFSNVFYFLSGLYLLNAKPLRGDLYSSILDDTNKKQSRGLFYHDGRHPMLGWLVLCSGGISLLYHSFQALGSLQIAESLCYVDHGLALSSGCYFLDKCGMPSLKTCIIGVSSLCLLAIGGDIYPIIHSLWHVGSAGATISWASDGTQRRKRFISVSLKQRRSLKMAMTNDK